MALFEKVFGKAGVKTVMYHLTPVKPFSITVGTLGCHIKEWESNCDSVGCHMVMQARM